MIRIAIPILLVTAAPVAAVDYFPLAEGNTWAYKVGDQADRFTVRAVGAEAVGDVPAVALQGTLRNRVVATDYVGRSGSDFVRLRVDREVVAPAVPFLKVPAGKEPVSWKAEFSVGGRSASAAFTAEFDEVEVPAGRFRAVLVRGLVTDGPTATASRAWYAPGVGLVKQIIEEGKRPPLVLELEKFTPGAGK